MNTEETSRRILRILLRRRRGAATAGCAGEACENCLKTQLPAVRASVKAGLPVVLALPGFPCKSPNPAKVLGALPDMAEEIALKFLADLCRKVQDVYAPGAHLVICSDGRVFSDLIGVTDQQVTAYQDAIRRMIRRYPERLSLFSLDDFPGISSSSYEQMRSELDHTYSESPQSIREAIRAGGEPLSLYRAVTRFLFEDALTPRHSQTRSALQRDARRRAYGVIRRSRAWGALVMEQFADAARLSIHPQRCGSPKFGIQLTPENDGWLTPWHAVAVQSGDGYVLRRRSEVEQEGARLIHRDGRPSHFVGPSDAGSPAPGERLDTELDTELGTALDTEGAVST